MNQIHHKIRGSYPYFIGIELPKRISSFALDEDNYNAYRKHQNYNGFVWK